MSQSKNKGKVPSGCALSRVCMLRVSPRKLNLLASLLRGCTVSEGLRNLSFAPQRIASDVKKLLLSAIANAENNHGLDIDKLEIVEATVGRAMLLKRLDIKGRSRSGRIMKPFSNMRIIVGLRERTL